MYILKEVNDISQEQMQLDERTQFIEMSMDPMSAVEDRLPFKLVLMNPDAGAKQPHVHIYGRTKSGKEIGTFLLTKNPPKSVDDLIAYTAGQHKGLKNVPMEWQQMIVDWAEKRSYLDPLRNNWQNMQHEYYVNCYLFKTNL